MGCGGPHRVVFLAVRLSAGSCCTIGQRGGLIGTIPVERRVNPLAC